MGIESIAPRNSGGLLKELGAIARAALRAESWLPTHNAFVVFGLAWGLPIPLATLSVECLARGVPLSAANLIATLAANSLQWLFMLHPLLFAGVFGSIGTVANDRARDIDRLLHELQGLADTDGLTGLLNHRAFQTRIREEGARAEREGRPITLLMIDIDLFKALNDLYGHLGGDQVLVELARRMVAMVRPYDTVARYGGEEFTVVLPGMDAAEAARAAERIRLAVANAPFAVGDARVTVTVSIGVAMHGESERVEEWIAAADQRLYQSKAEGRNRTTPPPAAPSSVRPE